MGNTSSTAQSQIRGDERTASSSTKVNATNKTSAGVSPLATAKDVSAQTKQSTEQSATRDDTNADTNDQTMAPSAAAAATKAPLNVPLRPANLGDALEVVDIVKEAANLEQMIDAQQQDADKSNETPLKEGKYSVYNSATAHARLPSVSRHTDCVREAQMRFRDAQHVLRCQRNRALACNLCAGGGLGSAFENNVRSARTNDALLRREQRTMQANLVARSRLANARARASTLEHVEATTRTSDAALPIATMADKTTEAERKAMPMLAKANAANAEEETMTKMSSVSGAETRERPSRQMALKMMHMNAQAPSDCNCALAPVVHYQN